jgi:site-specific recombinase XerD
LFTIRLQQIGLVTKTSTYMAMIALTTAWTITWPRPDKNGLLPVKLKISVKGGGFDYIPLNMSVHPDYWDQTRGVFKNTHPNATMNNEKIALVKKVTNDVVNHLTLTKRILTAAELKKMIVNGESPGVSTDFFEFAKKNLSEKKGKIKDRTIGLYENKLNLFKEYNQGNTLSFDRITEDFIAGFEGFLIHRQYTRYYIQTILNRIKEWVAVAVKKGMMSKNPFDDYKITTGVPAEKDYFSMQEIKSLEKYASNTTDDSAKETLAWILFGCFTGLRISDWYLFDYKKRVIDGEVRLRAKKTIDKRNSGFVSLKMVGPVLRAVEGVKDRKLTLTSYGLRYRINKVVETLGIDKHITPHSTRKTFASTMCASIGINVTDCAKLMGISVKVCEDSYYRVTNYDLNRRTEDKWKDL